MKKIEKLLVANRGEIACRIMRTAKERGIKTVAVFSDADIDALHVHHADEAICIGGSEPAQSYLKIDAIIDAATCTGADAIHPGYGFLSERAEFAQACEKAGIIFVGPRADAIAAMGDKAEAKRRMKEAGVPTIPGYQGELQDDKTLLMEAEKVGFPLMVKASAGGGGRGMRIVESQNLLAEAISSARKEAESAFGDGRLILERAISGARHVEVQIFADQSGDCIHLGERDCSLQRRHQKVIEEAPSPVISAEKRAEMGVAAISAASAVNYCGAGTVEFLYDPKSDEFYFLEMNTRLQVEHPVTELITGIDLVALQLDVAEGAPLGISQNDVTLDGWSMEARLYAEDPAFGFLPHSGEVRLWHPSSQARIDTGVIEGSSVTAFYDPMIAKVITHGRTRDEARNKLAVALRNSPLLGFAHNRDFLVALLEDEGFACGNADTGYIERNLEQLTKRQSIGDGVALALLGAILTKQNFEDPLTGWNSRGVSSFPLLATDAAGQSLSGDIELAGRIVKASANGEIVSIAVLEKTNNTIRFRLDDTITTAFYSVVGDTIEIDHCGVWNSFIDVTLAPAAHCADGDGAIKAPMAGIVTSINVTAGEVVKKGSIVATMEAMKMEHQLRATRDGVVTDVLAKQNEQVAIRARILLLGPEA